MDSPQSRTPLGRLVVTGACATALLLGPAAGMAAADDASLAKTVTERAQQLDKREKALATSLKTLQKSPSLSRAKTAQKNSAAFYRTTDAFRDEVREDDGSTDKGIQARDAVLPELSRMVTSAQKLDRELASAVKKRRVSKAVVTKVVSAKLSLDKQIGKTIAAIAEAFADDGPVDPAPKPTDPTA